MPDEPVIMPWQAQPFNNDYEICAEFVRLRDKFGLTTAVELGSAVGGTTRWLCTFFKKVVTIEINPTFRDICLKRVGSFENLISKLGDTVEVLPNIICGLDDNIIIFIDSHWNAFCPLEKELEIIAASGLKPVLAIHDFVVPGRPEFGFDSYNGQAFTFDWLKPHFDKIYGEEGYYHYYNTRIIEESAKRGILFVAPKKITISAPRKQTISIS